MSDKRRRPWKVFVRDIGPSYTFATKEAAIARAEALIGPEFALNGALVGNWSDVLVYDAFVHPPRHIRYRQGHEPVVEVFNGAHWIEEPLANIIAQEGCDRCFCGCKYWEHDRCIDCSTHVRVIPVGPDGYRDGTSS